MTTMLQPKFKFLTVSLSPVLAVVNPCYKETKLLGGKAKICTLLKKNITKLGQITSKPNNWITETKINFEMITLLVVKAIIQCSWTFVRFEDLLY